MIKKIGVPLRALQYIVFIILSCTAISGSIRRSKGKNITQVQSALLNPKYSAAVTEIKLKQENNTQLTFKRADKGFWTGTLQALQSTSNTDLIFPVDTVKIQNLLSEYRKVRNMYIISDNFKRYFFSDQTISLTFSGKPSALHTQKDFSQLYFASAQSPCIVHSARSASVYRTDDELCGFLSLYPAAWLDPKLFCDFILNGKSEADVQKIQYTQFRGTQVPVKKILASGDRGFEQAVHELLSAQSLKIGLKETAADASNITQQSAAVFENRSAIKITLFFDASHTASVFLYPVPLLAQNANPATEYIAIPDEQSLFYSLRISAASFERMCAPFIR